MTADTLVTCRCGAPGVVYTRDGDVACAACLNREARDRRTHRACPCGREAVAYRTTGELVCAECASLD